MKINDKDLTLKKRAKTFYFASFFLPHKTREDIEILYVFCRYLDDLGDNSNFEKKKKLVELNKIKKEIILKKSKKTIINNFIKLMNNYNINTKIPINLISGIKSDQKTFINYKTFSELVRYSYKVAGTVGYMFCKIIKENKKNQILRGIQLGIAMQLTNICRDIEEDLNMNRIYFPRTMRSFREEKQKIILKNKYIKNSISNDLPKLLDNAELIYNNAWDGIYNLKIRYAIPVAIAAELYKRIGYKIRNKNCDIWNKRIYLNIFEKIFFSIVAVLKLFFKKKRLILDKEIDHIIVNELIRLNVEL